MNKNLESVIFGVGRWIENNLDEANLLASHEIENDRYLNGAYIFLSTMPDILLAAALSKMLSTSGAKPSR